MRMGGLTKITMTFRRWVVMWPAASSVGSCESRLRSSKLKLRFKAARSVEVERLVAGSNSGVGC